MGVIALCRDRGGRSGPARQEGESWRLKIGDFEEGAAEMSHSRFRCARDKIRKMVTYK